MFAPLLALALTAFGSMTKMPNQPQPLVVDRLRCEALENPLGMDVAQPRLSWIVASPTMGQRQSAYQILVASSPERLEKGNADLWDSDKIASAETRDIPYAGAKLARSKAAFWRVIAWDKDGVASAPSRVAHWTMGLINPKDLHAKWLGVIEHPRLGIGYHALESTAIEATKWVQVNLDVSVPIDRIVLHPVRDHMGYFLFGFPLRFRVEIADEPTFAHPTVLRDETHADFPPFSHAPPAIAGGGHRAKYVRVTATKLWARTDGVGCFALAEIEVFSHGKNVAVGRSVSALDSVERDGWTHRAMTDGAAEGQGAPFTMLLRKEFEVAKPIKRALAYVTGLGQYEMTLNGEKVGQDWITPGWTQYAKTILLDTYDVTTQLRQGRNVAGLHIGNGMYDMRGDTRGMQQQNSLGTHRALCQIEIEYTDGTSSMLVTDKSWQWSRSGYTYSGVFGGEDFDARLQAPGWDRVGLADAKWEHPLEVEPPKGTLRGITHAAPALREIEVRTPVSQTEPKPNTLVLNLGQNAPYVPELTVRGPIGTTVRAWPAETLHPDGTINQQTMRAGKYVSYTLLGAPEEKWHPAFWYCGSQYWMIDAVDADGKAIDPKTVLVGFRGLLVHSSAEPVGTFECSDTLFNQVYNLIHWSIRSNLASVISDCPHREKSGWLEEDHLVGPGLLYCYDLTAMFRKVVSDMGDTQQPDGMVPTMAPEYFFYDGGYRDSVEWGGAYLFMPRLMRDWYADKGLIALHYAGMRRYVDYLGTRAKSDILSNGLGDWTGFGHDERTPIGITDTCYYYLAVKTLAEFAGTLGKLEDATKYGTLADRVKGSFQREYFHPETGSIGTGSQSGIATALDLGLIDPPYQAQAFERLLDDVKAHDYAVDCGEIGHPSLLRVLAKNGRSDIVAKIHSQTDKPGYGYQVKLGMTTLAEAWDARPISLNHFMMGHLMEWFYADLVGINPDPAHPGYTAAIIKPQPVPQVSWAKGSYRSIHGLYAVSWKVMDGRFEMEVEIPANCAAQVWIPTSNAQSIRIEDTSTAEHVSAKPVDHGEYGVLSLSSGRYQITATR